MTQPMPALGFLSGDLGMLSQVQAAATSLGWKTIWARDLESVTKKLEPTQTLAAIVADLALDAINVQQLATQVRALYPDTKLIAFGPHVHEERLAQAQAAAFDSVLSRGGFLRDIRSHLQ